MKNSLTLGILIFVITLFTTNCSNDIATEFEMAENLHIQDAFSLNNFDNAFVKNNLEIDWNDFNTSYNSENGIKTYEFNSRLKVSSIIGDYSSYKLLAFNNEIND
jgi:hypothetical protein